MAFTRKMLKAMGIEDEKIDQIMDAHVEVTEALKSERDGFKEKADKLDSVQKKLEKLEAKGDDGFEEKFNKEHAAFEKYKTEQEEKQTLTAKENAFKEILKTAGIPEKHMNSVLKVSDFKSLELDENGKAKDVENHVESVKKEWADFIPSVSTQGANTATPPENNPNGKDPFEIGFDEG